MSDCDCGLGGEWVACIEGTTYGSCEDENCGGVCEMQGDCDCACHVRLEAKPRS